MKNISDFKNFIEETKIKLESGLREYFKEETEILDSIIDMTREWEDEGLEFTYSWTMTGIQEHLGEEDIQDLDIIKYIAECDDLIEILREFEENRGIKIEIMLDGEISVNNSKSKECLESLSKRIKSAYPNINITSRHWDLNKSKVNRWIEIDINS